MAIANEKVWRLQPCSWVIGCSQRPKPCRMPMDSVTIMAPHSSTCLSDSGEEAGEVILRL